MSAQPLLVPCPPPCGAVAAALVRPVGRVPGGAIGHRRDDLPPAPRWAVVAGMAALHVAGAWALAQLAPAQPVQAETAPMQVSWIAPPADTPPPPARPAAPAPTPVIAAAPVPVVAPTPPAFTAPEPPAPTPPVATAPAPALTPAPPTPAPAAAPAAPKRVPASALRYTALPQQVYPLASRRMGESGTVMVSVVVDLRGVPREVALHRSSGFARLDEQALHAMRAARFQPCTEQGQAIECTAIAPLAYELD